MNFVFTTALRTGINRFDNLRPTINDKNYYQKYKVAQFWCHKSNKKDVLHFDFDANIYLHRAKLKKLKNWHFVTFPSTYYFLAQMFVGVFFPPQCFIQEQPMRWVRLWS